MADDDIPRESSGRQHQPSVEEEDQYPNLDMLDDWQVAKQGIVMWLNNEPLKAESFLKSRIDSSVHVMTSYTFINVIVSAPAQRFKHLK